MHRAWAEGRQPNIKVEDYATAYSGDPAITNAKQHPQAQSFVQPEFVTQLVGSISAYMGANLGAAAAGGAAGFAVGGPLGGTVGAALGSGVFGFADELGRTYYDMVVKGQSHEQAVDTALEAAFTQMGWDIATIPVAALRIAKSAIGNTFLRIGLNTGMNVAREEDIAQIRGEPSNPVGVAIGSAGAEAALRVMGTAAGLGAGVLKGVTLPYGEDGVIRLGFRPGRNSPIPRDPYSLPGKLKTGTAFHTGPIKWEFSLKAHGGTGITHEPTYFGLPVMLHPKDFLKIVPRKDVASDLDATKFIENAIAKGEALGPPTLDVVIDHSRKRVEVIGHEGRTRSSVADAFGVPAIPVVLNHRVRRTYKDPKGGVELRGPKRTDEDIDGLLTYIWASREDPSLPATGFSPYDMYTPDSHGARRFNSKDWAFGKEALGVLRHRAGVITKIEMDDTRFEGLFHATTARGGVSGYGLMKRASVLAHARRATADTSMGGGSDAGGRTPYGVSLTYSRKKAHNIASVFRGMRDAITGIDAGAWDARKFADYMLGGHPQDVVDDFMATPLKEALKRQYSWSDTAMEDSMERLLEPLDRLYSALGLTRRELVGELSTWADRPFSDLHKYIVDRANDVARLAKLTNDPTRQKQLHDQINAFVGRYTNEWDHMIRQQLDTVFGPTSGDWVENHVLITNPEALASHLRNVPMDHIGVVELGIRKGKEYPASHLGFQTTHVSGEYELRTSAADLVVKGSGRTWQGVHPDMFSIHKPPTLDSAYGGQHVGDAAFARPYDPERPVLGWKNVRNRLNDPTSAVLIRPSDLVDISRGSPVANYDPTAFLDANGNLRPTYQGLMRDPERMLTGDMVTDFADAVSEVNGRLAYEIEPNEYEFLKLKLSAGPQLMPGALIFDEGSGRWEIHWPGFRDGLLGIDDASQMLQREAMTRSNVPLMKALAKLTHNSPVPMQLWVRTAAGGLEAPRGARVRELLHTPTQFGYDKRPVKLPYTRYMESNAPPENRLRYVDYSVLEKGEFNRLRAAGYSPAEVRQGVYQTQHKAYEDAFSEALQQDAHAKYLNQQIFEALDADGDILGLDRMLESVEYTKLKGQQHQADNVSKYRISLLVRRIEEELSGLPNNVSRASREASDAIENALYQGEVSAKQAAMVMRLYGHQKPTWEKLLSHPGYDEVKRRYTDSGGRKWLHPSDDSVDAVLAYAATTMDITTRDQQELLLRMIDFSLSRSDVHSLVASYRGRSKR